MTKNLEYPVDLNQIKERVCQQLRDKKSEGRIPNWTHIHGGAETGATWQRNMDSYKSLGFKMKAINDVKQGDLDLSATLFGQSFRLPISAAPMSAAISFTHENAFVEMAKGCRRAGIGVSVGYPTGVNVHGRMLETGCPLFRLIKPLRDMDKLITELKASEADGCYATGIDIDSAAGLKPAGDGGHFADIANPLTVDELKTAIGSVDIPFIVKGVLGIDDALSAMEAGADAIVVSTHAGYAMDYCQSPLEVLPAIKETVGTEMKIIVDSGIARGSDIIKAMALGADFVLLGRLMIWGLLLGGSQGVEWIINILQKEMKRVMILLGIKDFSKLDVKCLVALNAMGKDILNEGELLDE